jgi:hypothetical protein
MACTGALAQGSPSREAPVGNRQPKASQAPQEQQPLSDPDKKMTELDDPLAKKLNGILSRLLAQSCVKIHSSSKLQNRSERSRPSRGQPVTGTVRSGG